MKSSIPTTVLIFFMTSYLCDACYFTNCPNKWNWRKRSDNDVIVENLKQRAEANPLLKSYLENNALKAPPKSNRVFEPMKTSDYDDTMTYDDVIIEKLLGLLDQNQTESFNR